MQQLKMQMRAGRLSGGTNQSNRLSPADRLSFRDPQLTAMPVKADRGPASHSFRNRHPIRLPEQRHPQKHE